MLDPKSGIPFKSGVIAISLLAAAVAQGQTADSPATQQAPTEQAPSAETPTATPETAPDPVTAPGKPAETGKTAPSGKGTPERIQVTGSRLKRVEAETSAPISVIKREEIAKSGTASVGDFFRKSASASPGGNFSGSSSYVAAGSSTINLLGLGDNRTLILVNGKRMPTLSGIGSFNIENIPTALVDRIEVLAGGASAVYGADAVGGVVNIVTRKDMVGTEVEAFINVPVHGGGEEHELSVAQGVTLGESSNFSISGGYRHRNPIDKRKRDLEYGHRERQYTVSNAPAGTYAYRPITVAGDGSVTFGNWTPSANCPAGNQIATVPTEPQNVYCAGLRKDMPDELIPEKKEWYTAATFDTTFGDWNLSSLLTFSRSTSRAVSGHMRNATDPLTGGNIYLSNARAIELGVIDASSTATVIDLIAPTPNAPDTVYTNINDSWVTGAYLSGDITESWKADFGLSYSQAFSVRKGENLPNSEGLSSIFVNPDTTYGEDPAYVPIDPERNSDLLYGSYQALESNERSENISADAFFSTDLAELPGGALTFGVGAAYSHEKFKQKPDPLDTQFNSINEPLFTGTFADKGKGNRTVGSAYTEINAPLLKQIHLDAALRFDNYSDFDSTVNYGGGLKYTVIPDFLALRGRAASSFKAPALADMHQEGGGGYFTIRDPNYCAREVAEGRVCDQTDPNRQIFVQNPGNKDLDPEIGTNYTLGFVLEPAPGLSLIADYYWIFLRDTFSTETLQVVVDEWYAQNGTNPTGGTIRANTIQVDEDGIATQIGLPVQNLGRLKTRLVSTKLDYQTNFGPYRARFNSDYTQLLSIKEQDTKEDPMRETKGYFLQGQFANPRWRWNNFVEFGTDDQSGRLVARTIAKSHQDPVRATASSLNAKVPAYTEYDFIYSLSLPTKTSLELGVNNIFDTIGGVNNGNDIGSEDVITTSLYSYTGRAFFAKATQRF